MKRSVCLWRPTDAFLSEINQIEGILNAQASPEIVTEKFMMVAPIVQREYSFTTIEPHATKPDGEFLELPFNAKFDLINIHLM